MDVLALVFPIHLVAHNVLQIFVGHHIIFSHKVGGIAYHLFGDAYLASNLHGKGAAGIAHLEHEERLHLGAIVEHGAVAHRGRGVGIVLEVLIMGGDDTERANLHETIENGFCQRTTDLGLGATAKLVDEHQAAARGVAHHLFHVEQVGRIGAEIVFQTLFVANVDEDVGKDATHRAFAHGNGHAALQHVLQEAHRFQTHRLATGIRTRDEQNAGIAQADVERHHAATMARQTLLQKRMHGLPPVDARFGHDARNDGTEAVGKHGEGTQIVHVGQKML